jgi:HlyD family secretion protein
MGSKDLKPKRRLGKYNPRRAKIIAWTIGLLAGGSGLYAAYHYGTTTQVDVAVARARRGDFVISARARGDIKSSHSTVLKAPQAPGLRIVRLVTNGSRVKKGEVVVQFDAATQEQTLVSQTISLRAVEGDYEQLLATQKMSEGFDSMNKMQSEYDVERTKLDASKAQVISAIDGEKSRIKVGVSEGSLQQVKATINAHQVGNEADQFRVNQRRIKAQRDLETTTGYLGVMELRAPADGFVNILSNFRSRGTYGRSTPPFKEGDDVWAGAEIAELPNLDSLYIDLKLDEVDRGRLQIGQDVRLRVDAIPDREFDAELDFISPIAALVFKGGATAEKAFPATAQLKTTDERLRPGMSASAEIIIERQPNKLLIPARASFDHEGRPAVYVQRGTEFLVRPIEVGKRNDDDIIVTSGVQEGDIVTLESPAEAAKRAKRK